MALSCKGERQRVKLTSQCFEFSFEKRTRVWNICDINMKIILLNYFPSYYSVKPPEVFSRPSPVTLNCLSLWCLRNERDTWRWGSVVWKDLIEEKEANQWHQISPKGWALPLSHTGNKTLPELHVEQRAVVNIQENWMHLHFNLKVCVTLTAELGNNIKDYFNKRLAMKTKTKTSLNNFQKAAKWINHFRM